MRSKINFYLLDDEDKKLFKLLEIDPDSLISKGKI